MKDSYMIGILCLTVILGLLLMSGGFMATNYRLNDHERQVVALQDAVDQTQDMVAECKRPPVVVVGEIDCLIGWLGCATLICPEPDKLEDTPGEQARDGKCWYRLWCCKPQEGGER